MKHYTRRSRNARAQRRLSILGSETLTVGKETKRPARQHSRRLRGGACGRMTEGNLDRAPGGKKTMKSLWFTAAAALALGSFAGVVRAGEDDPYLWLEDTDGARAL